MSSVEKIVIVSLIIICIILVVCLILKKEHKKEMDGKPGNWSEKQKNVIYDKVLYAIMLHGFDLKGYVANICRFKILDLFHCIVNNIADKYSYEYANLNFMIIINDNNVMNKLKDDCACICVGKKGKWSDDLKQKVYEKFSSLNLPEPENLGDQCVSCIVNQLENNYDPLDPVIVNLVTNNKFFDYSKELALCKYTQKCM